MTAIILTQLCFPVLILCLYFRTNGGELQWGCVQWILSQHLQPHDDRHHRDSPGQRPGHQPGQERAGGPDWPKTQVHKQWGPLHWFITQLLTVFMIAAYFLLLQILQFKAEAKSKVKAEAKAEAKTETKGNTKA